MPTSAAPTSIQCVILHRRGEGIDSRLLRALETKSISVATTCDDGHHAFAELCKLARGGSRSNVLIVTNPRDRDRNASLLGAMERFPLHARMWIFDADNADRQLFAADRADFEAAPKALPKIDVHPSINIPPTLRLTDHAESDAVSKPAEYELTDEELIALTAPPPDFKATR